MTPEEAERLRQRIAQHEAQADLHALLSEAVAGKNAAESEAKHMRDAVKLAGTMLTDAREELESLGRLYVACRDDYERLWAVLEDIADGPDRHDAVQSIKKAKRALGHHASPTLKDVARS